MRGYMLHSSIHKTNEMILIGLRNSIKIFAKLFENYSETERTNKLY